MGHEANRRERRYKIMTEYGRGSVLGAATVLPFTAGVLLMDVVHPLIVIGFIAISVISLIILVSYIGRYLINRKNGQSEK